MPSGQELQRQIKSEVREVDPREVHDQLSANGNGRGAILVDVRETEEFVAGHIPGAVHVPRSYLETRIEGAVGTDRDRPIVLYCAVGQPLGVRRPRAHRAARLHRRHSMVGGFTRWKDRGYEVEVPRSLSAEQPDRYSRHLLIPEVGLEGQQKLLDAKILLLGAGGLGSPAALYLAAAGVGTLGIVDDDVVDRSNLQRQIIHTTDRIGGPRSTPPRRRSGRSTPTSSSSSTRPG